MYSSELKENYSMYVMKPHLTYYANTCLNGMENGNLSDICLRVGVCG